MINEWKARETICEVGRRLYGRGFAAANDGNISIRLGENRFLCTPTGVSKGFLKPDDLCIVDQDGKQLAGTKKRTSEILLHLSVYKARPDIGGAVHCHPPHATAFAIVHEAIPKAILPEVEVFLGEVPIARYETPGTQRFADTVLPYVNDANTIILANHGTIAYAKDLMTAYFNTEILDAYCRMLILAKQLGQVNYLNEKEVVELLEFKKRLGIADPRLDMMNCDLLGNSIFREGYDSFAAEHHAFPPPAVANTCSGLSPRKSTGDAAGHGSVSGDTGMSPATAQVAASVAAAVEPMASSAPAGADLEQLVKLITEQVMASLNR
jgi:L-fuculose-phosphate aldolase